MKRSTLRGECIAEFIGTAILLLIIEGVGAACTLTNATYGQWELALIAGLALSAGIYVAGGVSGAHLNPAVTIAMTMFRDFQARKVIPYILSQVAGAFFGAAVIFGLYHPLLVEFQTINGIALGSPESLVTGAIFSTYAISQLSNFEAAMVEALGTALLVCTILAVTDDRNGTPKGAMAALVIGLVVAIIGGALGPLTGAALNPARDFGPKLFEFFAGWGSIAFTGGRVDPYVWVPIVGPIVGGCIGAFVYEHGISRYLDDATLEATPETAVEDIKKFKKTA